jgi:hypothetical protein
VGAVGSYTPTGTDQDELKQWEEMNRGQGIGEVIYDDADDAADVSEFKSLIGTDDLS